MIFDGLMELNYIHGFSRQKGIIFFGQYYTKKFKATSRVGNDQISCKTQREGSVFKSIESNLNLKPRTSNFLFLVFWQTVVRK